MDRFAAVETFVRVVETGSFSGAEPPADHGCRGRASGVTGLEFAPGGALGGFPHRPTRHCEGPGVRGVHRRSTRQGRLQCAIAMRLVPIPLRNCIIAPRASAQTRDASGAASWVSRSLHQQTREEIQTGREARQIDPLAIGVEPSADEAETIECGCAC
jgi:hypothetical protein